MQDTTVYIQNVWDILKEYLPEKDKQIAADHLMQYLTEIDIPHEEFTKMVKSDPYLEVAAEDYLEEDDYDLYED